MQESHKNSPRPKRPPPPPLPVGLVERCVAYPAIAAATRVTGQYHSTAPRPGTTHCVSKIDSRMTPKNTSHGRGLTTVTSWGQKPYQPITHRVTGTRAISVWNAFCATHNQLGRPFVEFAGVGSCFERIEPIKVLEYLVFSILPPDSSRVQRRTGVCRGRKNVPRIVAR